MLKLKRGGAPSGVLTSFAGGMGALTEALARTLADRVRTGREVRSIERSGGGPRVVHDGGQEVFDAVVAAVPAHVLGKIFPAALPLCEKIYYPPLAVVHLGYKSGAMGGKADGFGFLTTRKAGTTLLGAVFPSNMFAGRAPAGYGLITAMAGGAHSPGKAGLNDEELISAVSGDLRTILGIGPAPEFARVFRHERAIPNYAVGHSGLLAKLEKEGEDGGIFLAGNAFYGVGVNDAVLRAREAARRVVERLKERK